MLVLLPTKRRTFDETKDLLLCIMGRYTFFRDFLITDVSNHMEALKEMVKLGSEDDRFLVPALFHLAREDSSELDQENKGL